ncbi:TonB family protein [Pseudotabrizicola sp. 4114]|uniref:cell envelope integrity protein TolA n=1 Tax=Pseudotabrizicola sp. 4114 TaxID=2817731 RepID=UPI00285D6352|nr:protein TonB [Pseudorhodobacter sp. 4114]
MTSAPVQAVCALTLAIGLHIAAFVSQPAPAGAVSSGAGGEDLVSLQAADASLADLVADWDRPPQPVTEPAPELAMPEAPEPPPQMAALAEPALPPAPPPMLALPQMADTPLVADVTLPEPPPDIAPEPEPEPEPVPKVRPKAKPQVVTKPPEPRQVAKPAEQKKPPASQPSAGQVAQKAAGTGGGAQAGQGGEAQAATLSAARINDLQSSWGASVRARVERRKRYPSAARGASGTVTVRLTVSRAGALTGVGIAKSSGNAALDEAAISAVRQAGKFAAAPKGLTDASYSFTLPMKFAR